MNEISEKMLILRKSKNLLQRDISELLNVSIQVYNRYELGYRKPKLEFIKRMADYYEMPVEFFFDTNESNIDFETFVDPSRYLIEYAKAYDHLYFDAVATCKISRNAIKTHSKKTIKKGITYFKTDEIDELEKKCLESKLKVKRMQNIIQEVLKVKARNIVK